MKIGFIGCGGMGSTHNQCLKKLSEEFPLEVTAIADCRQDFLERALNLWPEAKGYTRGEDLLANEKIDVVYICVPSYIHTKLTLIAMKKNIDVFVEKPVCLTEKECNELLEQHKATPVNVMVGQVVRSTQEYVYLKQLYEKQTYGEMKTVMMQRVSGNVNWGYNDWFHDPQKSGSVILDLHIHDIDFLRYMLGEPNYVDVHVSRFDSGMINHIMSNYKFGKVHAAAEGVWHMAAGMPFQAEYRADFDEATVCYDSRASEPLVIYTTDGTKIIPDICQHDDGEYEENGTNIHEYGAYFLEDRYYMNCLINKKKNTRATLEDAVESVRLGIRELKMADIYG